MAAALKVLEGADRAARFLVGATRKGWREDFTVRFPTINGLPVSSFNPWRRLQRRGSD